MTVTIRIRPLKGDIFEVNAENEDKVIDLKKKIAGMRTDSPADLQKLIHAGKILDDASLVSEHGIKATDFVVLMTSKAKPAAAAPPPASATSAGAAPAVAAAAGPPASAAPTAPAVLAAAPT